MELKPCPFCGGEAMTDTATYESGGYYTEAFCVDCGADIARGSKEEAIEAWNRRKPYDS